MASATWSDEAHAQDEDAMSTTVLPIRATNLGNFSVEQSRLPLDNWDLRLSGSDDACRMRQAAHKLQTSDIPVGFPTETVYGLGADATRSAAVKGIYTAKQRPSDNPLIVHIASLGQLRQLLNPTNAPLTGDPIPAIYHPLIKAFWPGPLTIILPNPEHSKLAPEVTAGLDTFGARMPRSLLALTLIKLANVPIAAPSANASTKPSPTAAEHVMHDLNGRIELIIDGGPCDVGVESTVVDGLSSPPSILRPGGIGLAEIRACKGWEDTVVGYHDVSELGSKPRAPGMKYRHYSPKAPVILIEAGGAVPTPVQLAQRLGNHRAIGVVRTKTWPMLDGARRVISRHDSAPKGSKLRPAIESGIAASNAIVQMLMESKTQEAMRPESFFVNSQDAGGADAFTGWDLCIGPETKDIARGLFSALRDLDQIGVDAIVVEGINDGEGDVAAAVMNRLRKAAEVKTDRL